MYIRIYKFTDWKDMQVDEKYANFLLNLCNYAWLYLIYFSITWLTVKFWFCDAQLSDRINLSKLGSAIHT